MESKKKWILLFCILAVILIGAAAGYRVLSGRVSAPSGNTQAAAAEKTEAVPGTAAEEHTEEPYAAMPEGEPAEERKTEETPAAIPEGQSAAKEKTEEAKDRKTAETGDAPDPVQDISAPADVPETAETEAALPADDLSAAPDFTVETIEGIPVRFSDLLGSQPIILNFWASWCPPCKAELPYFQEAYETYGGRIRFMMVDLLDGSRETETAVQSFISGNGYTFPIYADRSGDASYAYGIYSIPLTVAVTPEGGIFYEHTGALSQEELQRVIGELLGE